jgi:hypothetical protein
MSTIFEIANLSQQKEELTKEIKTIYDNFKKPSTIPLNSANLCGLSVNCELALTSGIISLDITSKTICQGMHDGYEKSYMTFPSKIIFASKDFVKKPSSEEIETSVNKIIQIFENISFDKKLNKFNFVSYTSNDEKPIRECAVCFEMTNGSSFCRHPLCLPCWEQMQLTKRQGHDCPNCLDCPNCPICRKDLIHPAFLEEEVY